MNCDEARDLVQPYIDNELDVHVTLAVRDHVESCPACGRLLSLYLKQDSLLQETARADSIDTSALRKRITTMIAREAPRPRPGLARRMFRQPWFRVAAGVVLSVSIASYFLWFNQSGADLTLCAAAASDHADHCAVDSKVNAITDPQELAILARGFGIENGVPDLSRFGFGSPRGRTCRVGAAKYLHLVYYGAGQEPLSVFVRSNHTGPESSDLTLSHQLGYQVAIATAAEVELVVVTSLDEKNASEIARAIHS
jgi:anti-sigma factor RsiW